MAIPRFFFTGKPKTIESLKDDSLRHMRALRLNQGDGIILFDGAGNEYFGILREFRKDEAIWELKTRKFIPPKPCAVAIACSLPKGKRQAFLIEKLSELGVARFIPLISSRTVVRPNSSAIARLQKIATEGARQSGQTFVMKVEEPMQFDESVELRDYDLKLVAMPDGACLKEILRKSSSIKSILCLVGPEGGFTDKENGLANKNGFQKATLGRALLRIETAAMMIAAAIDYEFG
jgi:16S rRNA (uracil1498-N3)-methyltransferase